MYCRFAVQRRSLFSQCFFCSLQCIGSVPAQVTGVADTRHVEMDFVGKVYRRRIARSGCSALLGQKSQFYGLAPCFMENKRTILRNAVAGFDRTQLVTSRRHRLETVSSI